MDPEEKPEATHTTTTEAPAEGDAPAEPQVEDDSWLAEQDAKLEEIAFAGSEFTDKFDKIDMDELAQVLGTPTGAKLLQNYVRSRKALEADRKRLDDEKKTLDTQHSSIQAAKVELARRVAAAQKAAAKKTAPAEGEEAPELWTPEGLKREVRAQAMELIAQRDAEVAKELSRAERIDALQRYVEANPDFEGLAPQIRTLRSEHPELSPEEAHQLLKQPEELRLQMIGWKQSAPNLNLLEVLGATAARATATPAESPLDSKVHGLQRQARAITGTKTKAVVGREVDPPDGLSSADLVEWFSKNPEARTRYVEKLSRG